MAWFCQHIYRRTNIHNYSKVTTVRYSQHIWTDVSPFVLMRTGMYLTCFPQSYEVIKWQHSSPCFSSSVLAMMTPQSVKVPKISAQLLQSFFFFLFSACFLESRYFRKTNWPAKQTNPRNKPLSFIQQRKEVKSKRIMKAAWKLRILKLQITVLVT